MPRLARFVPHAIVQVKRPSPLFVAAVLGTAGLRIEIDRKLPSAVWLRYCLAKLNDLHEMWQPTSLVINFRNDFAVRYSLTGEVLEVMDRVATAPFVYAATLH
jgi:hypothetical protein